MTSIDTQRLRDLLFQIDHATPLTVTCLTTPKSRKHPFESLQKITTLNCFTAFDYTASVNRAREKGGDDAPFQRAPRSWGEWASPALIRAVKDNVESFYLSARIRHRKEPVYLVRQNGIQRIVRKAVVAPYLPPEREQEVPYREIRLDSIIRVAMERERFAVVP